MTVEIIGRDRIEQMFVIEQSCFLDEAWTKAMLCEGLECPGALYFGALENGRLLGYAALLTAVDVADIGTVGVLPEFQGRGIGETLVRALEDFAAKQGIKKMFLEVNEENFPAIKLYQKCGFQKISVRKNYYDTQRFSSRDAIVMAKSL